MANNGKVIIMAALVLLFVGPISLYYMGTLEGVNFSNMAILAVEGGVFLFILFIVVYVLMRFMGGR